MFGWIQSGYSNTAFSNVGSDDLIIRTQNSNAQIVLGTGKDSTRNATMYLTSNSVGIHKVPAPNTLLDVASILSVNDNSNVSISTQLITPVIQSSSNIVASNIQVSVQSVSSLMMSSNIQVFQANVSNLTVASNLYVETSILPNTTSSPASLGNINTPFGSIFVAQSNEIFIGDISISKEDENIRIYSDTTNKLTGISASEIRLGQSNPVVFTKCNNQPLLLYTECNGEWRSIPIIEDVWSINNNIGVGTSNPEKKLDVEGDVVVRGDVFLSSGRALFESNISSVPTLHINASSTYSNIFLNGPIVSIPNNLGIGTSNPQYALDVPGIARLRNVLLSQNQLPFLVYNDYADVDQRIPSYGIAVPETLSNVFLSGKDGITILTSNAPVVFDEKVSGVGIKTTNVNGLLQFPNTDDFRKIVLYEKANNDFEVTSIGTIDTSNLVFQVPGSNGNFKFFVGQDNTTSTDVVTITGAGCMRIGTTSANSPTEKLEVEGNIKIKDTLLFGNTVDTATVGRFLSAGYPLLQPGDRVSMGMGKTNTLRNQAEITYVHSGDGSSNNTLILGYTNVDVLTIKADGAVGIATASPEYDLDVRGTIFASGDLIVESNIFAMSNIITSGIQSATGELLIGTDEFTNIITIGGGNSNPTTINIGGIGDIINIQGDMSYVQVTNTAITDNNILLNRGGSNTAGAGFDIERNSNITAGYFRVSSNETGFVMKPPLSSNIFEVDISSTSSMMSLNKNVHFSYSNSNVGFGTAPNVEFPRYSVHVARESNTSFSIETLSNDTATFSLENSLVRWQFNGPLTSSNNALLLNVYNKDLLSFSNSYLSITSDGRFGILKDNPAYELDVAGTINATAVLVNGQPLSASAGSPGGGTGAGWAVAGSNIYSDSNIGINKTNPNFELDVDGTINATEYRINGFPLSAAYWSTSNAVMYSLSNVGIGTTDPQYALDIFGTINATNVLVNGQNISSGFWQINAGSIYSMCNVGIGTTTPSRRLDVVGDARILGDITTSGRVIANRLELASNATINGILTLTKPMSITSTQWGDGIIFNGNGNNRIYVDELDSQLVVSIDGTSNFQIKTAAGCNLIKLTGTDGNFGIGVSSPSSKLHVDGAITATSYCNMTWNMISSKPTFATAAFTGSYDDLVNKPALCNVAFTGRYIDIVGAPSLTGLFATQSWNDLLNKPSFATVSYTGDYSDLNNKPSLCNIAFSGKWQDVYEVPQNLSAIANNDLSNFTQTAVFQQKVGIGVAAPDMTLEVQGAIKATSYCNVEYTEIVNRPSLCNVATTGNFLQLNNIPALSYFTNDISYFACNVGIKQITPLYSLHVNGAVFATSYCNIDWSMIRNTPNFASPTWAMLTDAPSNLSFFNNDLSNFGVITATSYCNLSWSMIQQKPSFCNIATTGSWLDLENKPRTLTAAFLNDLSYFECNVGIGVSPSTEYSLIVQGAISAGSYCNMTWNMISSKPTFSAVAVSGNWNDIVNRPTTLSFFNNDLSNFQSATVRFNGSVGIQKTPTYALDVNGAVNATSYCNIDWTMVQNRPTFDGNYNNLINLPILSTVALSGQYNDLTGIPAFCNVSTTAQYQDLLGTPALATLAYANSNTWENIDNKPVFSAIATSGAWTDILDRPTALSTFSNDLSQFTGPITVNGTFTTTSNTVIQGAMTLSNDAIIDGNVSLTGTLRTNNFTTMNAQNTMNIAHTSNVSIVNIGVFDDVAHTINIATGNAGSTQCNVIRLGNAQDFIIVPGTYVRSYVSDTYTSNRTFTMNAGGTDAGGVGIFMEENSNNTAYIKLSNDRKSFLMKTPFSATDAVFDLTSNSIMLNESVQIHSLSSNVGIGVSKLDTPTEKLHIQQGNIRLHNTNDVVGRSNLIRFTHVSSNNEARIESSYTLDNNNNPYVDLRFSTNSNSTLKQTLALKDGMVGIGTTSPMASLHVDGDISLKQTLLFKIDATSSWSNNKIVEVPNSNMLYLYAPSPSNIQPSITVSNNFIGINTTTPLTVLDVNGHCIMRSNVEVRENVFLGAPSNEITGNQRVSVGTMDSNGSYKRIVAFHAPSNYLVLGNSNEVSNFDLWGKTLMTTTQSNDPVPNETLLDIRGNARVQGSFISSNVTSCNINTLTNTLNTVNTTLSATSNQAFSVSGKWSQDGNDTYYTLGRVGIGRSNPQHTLDVMGAISASTYCNISYSMILDKPALSPIAYSGSNSYFNLTDAPALCNIATTGSWNDIWNRPTLVTLATTGEWTDVQNRPSSLVEFTNNLTYFPMQMTFCNNVGIKKNNAQYDLDVAGVINACNILINGTNLSQVITAGYWITSSGYQASVSNVIVGRDATPAANFHASQDVLISACNHSWPSTTPKGLYMRYSTVGSDDAAYIQSTTRATNQFHNLFIQASNIALGPSTPFFHIRNNGRVGIGTTTPNELLEVAGAIRAVSYCNVSYDMIQNKPVLSVMAYENSNTYDNILNAPTLSTLAYFGSNRWENIVNTPNFSQVAYDGAWSNLQGVRPNLSVFPNDLTSFNNLVTLNSNVQLANVVDGRKIALFNTQTSNIHQFFGFGVLAGTLRYQVDASTSDHAFFAGVSTTTSTEIMRIRGNGNVGIGTNTPLSRLHISNGSARIDGSSAPSISLVTNNTGSGTTDISMLRTSGDGFRIKTFVGSNAMTLAQVEVGGSEVNRIWVSSNIGIKTTNPVCDLHVNGVIYATAYSNVDWGSLVNVPTFISTPFTGSYTDLTNRPVALSAFSNDLSAFNRDVTFSSNVGIGVQIPSATLDVAGSTKTTTMQITSGNLSLSSLTSTLGSLSIASDNASSIINIGCPTTAQNTINIGNTTPISFINIGNNADTTVITSSSVSIATPQLSTNSKIITLNSSGPLESGGSCGIEIFENSNATGYMKVSADRSSLLLKTPLGAEMSINLTGNSVNINNNALWIGGNGTVGIGTSTPSQALEVVGSVRCAAVLTTSDERKKTNIVPITSALEKIQDINGVYFDWKDTQHQGKIQSAGVIAQDVEKVLPEAVVRDDDDNLSVNYGSLIGLLINAVKEQQKEIEILKSIVHSQ